MRFGADPIQGCTLEEAWVICHYLDILGDRQRDMDKATYEMKAWRRRG